MSNPLLPFPTPPKHPPPRVGLRMDVDWTPAGDLRVGAALDFPSASLRLPSRRPAGVEDGLWRHTCFELFVQGDDAPAYAEFNLSPSTQWAAYRFRDYRDAGVALVMPDPRIDCAVGDDELRLDACLSGAALPPGARLRIGLCAVLEDTGGNLSYWALAHTAARPDFHRADSFILELDRPR